MELDPISLLIQTKSTLENQTSNVETYGYILSQLGALVAQSSASEQARLSLVSNPKVSAILSEIVEPCKFENFDEYKLRIFRGCILLIRNLGSTGILAKSRYIHNLLSSFSQLIVSVEASPIRAQLIVSYVEALANIGVNADKISVDLKLVTNMLESVSYEADEEPIKLPVAIFLNNFFNSENLFKLLNEKSSSYIIMKWLVRKFEEMDTDNELDPSENILLEFAQNVISHESYNKWLHRAYEQSETTFTFSQIMKFNQIIVTSKEEWDSFQSAAILAWAFDFFKVFATLTEEILPKPIQEIDRDQLEIIHSNLISILDCISDMGKLNSTRQFLEHYNAMEELIKLLRVVHENVERKTLKKVEEVSKDELSRKAKRFPQIKSLIIEIISFMCHDSFSMQEKVREYHGLELVLSNCMIDDNDPYIKERAIICIKILLDKNSKNQQFVADLEAEQTVNDEALREVGYEVEIDNGQVKLRKSEKQGN
ncbi:copper transport protein 86 [[Candida] railenensis]|uniref:Ataxin-10 homolog n=1 Tax=[Candida] railenensis TaxID=45579 RepID=A0A9P0QT47_9ASCO|nr:copper transport protein 86 [[Candida] railenensis]